MFYLLLFWREMTSCHLTLRQPNCPHIQGSDMTSSLTMRLNITFFLKADRCHLVEWSFIFLKKAIGRNFENRVIFNSQNIISNVYTKFQILGAVIPKKSLIEKTLHTRTHACTCVHTCTHTCIHRQTLLQKRQKLYTPYILRMLKGLIRKIFSWQALLSVAMVMKYFIAETCDQAIQTLICVLTE